MARYKIEYEDGSYDLIKCPECNSQDIQHHHDEERLLDMICTTCKQRFELNATDKKIVQITTEPDREPPAIITGEKAKAQREYEETAKRLRKERNQ
jgi:DNA-directed RNA polymerase subunit RPC12/RpoP